MDYTKLKILAGVPITVSKKTITEADDSSKSNVGRCINRFIKQIDHKIGISKNREDQAEYNTIASDFEDVLMLVRAGKRAKSTKLYNDIPKTYREKFINSLNTQQAKICNEFFNSITEGCSSEDEESTEHDDEISKFIADNEGTDEIEKDEVEVNSDIKPNPEEATEEKPEEVEEPISNVECPYCDYTGVKSEFYDHIMADHIGGEDKDEKPDYEDTIHVDSREERKDDVSNNTNVDKVIEAVDATVWDKTDDKDESPSPYPKDGEEDKLSLPENIKKMLNTEISELKKQSELIIVSDNDTSEFYRKVCDAMEEVLRYLEMENTYGMKMAQVSITKFMSPIVQKFPSEVYDYIIRAGETESITQLFKKVKDKKNAIK